ncbi:MAG: hypothetical protein PF961_20175 [Planctomycetota bacterium]|jgi:DNA-binding transcriptional regulator YhcF (GntR family)|nr:hypothetical protein [Planctomycetota bacterium]
MAPTRLTATLTALRRELDDPSWQPQATAAMARHYRVGYTTMARALRQLANEGVLECHPGVPPRRPASNKASNRAAFIAECLAAEITTGHWRRGTPLPKISLLTQRFGCANATMIAACHILCQRDMLERVGRSYRVGPSLPVPHRSVAPSVLLVGESERFWHYQLTTTMATFFSRCTAELDAAGFRLHFAAHTDRPRMREIAATPGYRGAVILADAEPRQLKSILEGLARAEQPTLLFDHADRHPRIAAGLPQVRRLHGCERALARAILNAARLHGITTIGIPEPPIGWCQRRATTLARFAKRCGMRVERRPVDPVHWEVTYPATAFTTDDDFLHACGAEEARPLARRDAVRSACQAVFDLMDAGCDLILGLNDHLAHRCRLALHYGRAPGDPKPALLGIDNHIQTAIYGLSTIDTGFDALGYRAAHLLIGALPHTGRDTAEPSLRDRGSLQHADQALSTAAKRQR